MLEAGFEPAIPENERLQTHALNKYSWINMSVSYTLTKAGHSEILTESLKFRVHSWSIATMVLNSSQSRSLILRV